MAGGASSSLFIAGTDTGIGKTLVAAALLAAFARKGLKVVGMKPVASGSQVTAEGLRNEDALALMAHSNVAAPYGMVNPYCFEPAIAPHIAAAETGVRIDLARLQDAHARLGKLANLVVVEGAGGWLTPLDDSNTLADFARSVGARVVLVVGLRLGCINHALLTGEAIQASGLKLAGWVANTVDAQMARQTQNIETLQRRLPAPLLAVMPHRAKLTPAQAGGLFSQLPSLRD